MRLVSLVAFFSVCASFPVSGQDSHHPIRAIGEFSNAQQTSDDHAYGYALELWRDGDSVIGLFFVFEGLNGDAPMGAIENVTFDSRTGALSFTAKVSTGVVLLPGGGQEPVLELFEFSGTLKRSDSRQPSRTGPGERVQLKIRPSAGMAVSAESYADWTAQVDEILKRRGAR